MTVTAEGLKQLRKYVQDNWRYISVVNQADAQIFRGGIGTDSRISVTSDYVTNPLTVQVVVSGDDAEVTVSTTTVSAIKIYVEASGGTALVESTVTPFFFTSEDDELTINQTIEIPEIV